MKLTKNEAEDLIGLLEEYFRVFKNNKEHQEAHRKSPCPKCRLAKELLRKLGL